MLQSRSHVCMWPHMLTVLHVLNITQSLTGMWSSLQLFPEQGSGCRVHSHVVVTWPELQPWKHVAPCPSDTQIVCLWCTVGHITALCHPFRAHPCRQSHLWPSLSWVMVATGDGWITDLVFEPCHVAPVGFWVMQMIMFSGPLRWSDVALHTDMSSAANRKLPRWSPLSVCLLFMWGKRFLNYNRSGFLSFCLCLKNEMVGSGGILKSPCPPPQFISSCHWVSITKTEMERNRDGNRGRVCAALVLCAEGSMGVEGFLLLVLRFRWMTSVGTRLRDTHTYTLSPFHVCRAHACSTEHLWTTFAKRFDVKLETFSAFSTEQVSVLLLCSPTKIKQLTRVDGSLTSVSWPLVVFCTGATTHKILFLKCVPDLW